MASNVLVREVMTKNVKVVREDTNLHEVIATLSSFNINSAYSCSRRKTCRNHNYKRRIGERI